MILTGTINHSPFQEIIPFGGLASIIFDARGGNGGNGGQGGSGGKGMPG